MIFISRTSSQIIMQSSDYEPLFSNNPTIHNGRLLSVAFELCIESGNYISIHIITTRLPEEQFFSHILMRFYWHIFCLQLQLPHLGNVRDGHNLKLFLHNSPITQSLLAMSAYIKACIHLVHTFLTRISV